MLMGLCRTWFEKDDDVDDKGDICCSRPACLEATGMRSWMRLGRMCLEKDEGTDDSDDLFELDQR